MTLRDGRAAAPFLLIAVASLAPTAAPGQQVAAAPAESRPLAAEAVDPARLAAGWRMQDLLGEPVVGGFGEPIGLVNDLLLTPDGLVNAVIVKKQGALERDYASVPWGEILRNGEVEGFVAPMPADGVEFEGQPLDFPPHHRGPSAFLASELVGDIVTTADDVAFGAVVDLAFTPEGALLAALVQRQAALGGGLFAFPFTGIVQGLHPGVERIEIAATLAEATGAGHDLEPDAPAAK